MTQDSDTESTRPSPDDRPRAIVADDDPFARKMIKEALQLAGIVVIAEAQNGREAAELALYYRPEVVVMDVVMPELDGIAATRRIVKENPDQVVVILTSADDNEMGLLGLRAGAAGFLTKDLDIEVLPRALRGALSGEAVISRRMGMRLLEQLRSTPDRDLTGLRPIKSPLTPREWEVVDLLGDMTTDQIATELVLSSETVRSHVKSILRKLNARSRDEALAAVQRMRADPSA